MSGSRNKQKDCDAGDTSILLFSSETQENPDDDFTPELHTHKLWLETEFSDIRSSKNLRIPVTRKINNYFDFFVGLSVAAPLLLIESSVGCDDFRRESHGG